MKAKDEIPLILLVEDNENDERLALRSLKKWGAPNRVDVCRDGIEAVEYMGDPAKPCPDLVLLDLKLPRMNGEEVLRKVRDDERTCRVPIVVLTSSNEQSDVIGCFDSGANSFVRKPFEFEEYLERIAKVAEYWLTVNEPCE